MNGNFEERCHTSGPNRTQSGTNVQKLILRHIALLLEQKCYLTKFENTLNEKTFEGLNEV